MKTIIATLLFAVTLTGCSTVKNWIPSFWDDNQSARIIDVRQRAAAIDCGQPQLAQVQAVRRELQWFELYSESKGWRQADVLRITAPMRETLDDWIKRSQTQEGSKTYCELKKRVVEAQAKRAAEAILGRF
jgi:invasion protein IalB